MIVDQNFHEKLESAYACIEDLSAGFKLKKSELRESLLLQAEIISQLKNLQNQMYQMQHQHNQSILHKLMTPLGVTYNLIHDAIADVKFEEQDYIDAKEAIKKIKFYLDQLELNCSGQNLV